ncbi:Zn-dependent hydrolase [Defluviimonas sp. WL0050]|uniref:Zn-dependent hydrolase n=1 Tax=Albidovulum litorale TaxID=2984134 RepID=A0ABT2ZNJ6_9RHOB|nr:Zn-dependent hydrolase [Defluviimonas sp. WL0050]MCV2872714.1 Zn-dependent hydrolase [Defluviimonas sp. WL0050]
MTDWGARAESLLNELATCSEPGPGVTRLPFTPEHRAAIDLLQMHMEAVGLTVALDHAGTLIGRLEGPPGSKTLLMGSHQDSVREGGAYDGIMGVVLPLLALAKLRSDGINLPFTVEILAFADEEGVRFPTALIGSRALAGTFDAAVLTMTDSQGVTLQEAMTGFGLNPEVVGTLVRNPDDVLGFVETHIEQGPVLERDDQPLGVVTAICGIERHQIEITGETGHAGTLPMSGRRDALVTAAAIVTEVDRLGQTTPDLRATVGALTVEPNVVNAVPRRVTMTAEFRSPDDASRYAAGEALHNFMQKLSTDRRTAIKAKKTYSQIAQPCDNSLSAQLAAAAKKFGASGLVLPSGATHDASAMADLCLITMLFVRCRDGVSHTPEEFATKDDMGAGILALTSFLTELDHYNCQEN